MFHLTEADGCLCQMSLAQTPSIVCAGILVSGGSNGNCGVVCEGVRVSNMQ